MRLSLRVGAILAGGTSTELENLSRFAELLGDAYQLSDDLIDLKEDGEIFAENQLPVNKIRLNNLIFEAKTILIENFRECEARNCLIQLTEYLGLRKT